MFEFAVHLICHRINSFTLGQDDDASASAQNKLKPAQAPSGSVAKMHLGSH